MRYFWSERNQIIEDCICICADGIDVTGLPLFEDSSEYAAIQAFEAQALVELSWGVGEEMLQ